MFIHLMKYPVAINFLLLCRPTYTKVKENHEQIIITKKETAEVEQENCTTREVREKEIKCTRKKGYWI